MCLELMGSFALLCIYFAVLIKISLKDYRQKMLEWQHLWKGKMNKYFRLNIFIRRVRYSYSGSLTWIIYFISLAKNVAWPAECFLPFYFYFRFPAFSFFYTHALSINHCKLPVTPKYLSYFWYTEIVYIQVNCESVDWIFH